MIIALLLIAFSLCVALVWGGVSLCALPALNQLPIEIGVPLGVLCVVIGIAAGAVCIECIIDEFQ